MFCHTEPTRCTPARWRQHRGAGPGRPALLLAAALAAQGSAALAASDGGRDAPTFGAALSLDSERVTNLGGGIAPGSATDHLLKARLWIDGALFGLPAGSRLAAGFIHTWDGRPGATLVGDAQGFSNIAATPRSSLYTLYYRQRLADSGWTVRLGLVPADRYFDTADSAGLLINSSFGVQPTWSANTVAPIYPTAGIGAMATWSDGRWRNRAGVFQADPRARGSAFERGFLLLDEVNFGASAATTYKVGAWSYHPHDPPSAPLPKTTWGGYAIAEHALNAAANAPTAFVRVGWSPPKASVIPLGFQIGVLVPAPFTTRPDDQLSLGIASAHLRDQGVETAYEATYLIALSRHVSLQPDVQYVANPGGTYPDATVATLRLHAEF